MKITSPFWLLLGFIALISTGCSNDNSSDLKASRIEDSIGSKIDPETAKTLITINKSALGKEFLIQASYIEQAPIPTFHNLKSRVVTFEKKSDTLVMFESIQGHIMNDEKDRHLILTVYPIVKEQDEVISFDFNAGMQTLFISEGWRGQDSDGAEYDPENEFKATSRGHGFIKETKLDRGQNRFMIRQFAQLPSAGNTTVEIRYYLRPYEQNTKFTPTLSKDFLWQGYFETAPFMTKDGSTKIFATKFDVKKKIVFGISSNTPAEYKEAIREGILYWNKTGALNIQVVDAPEGLVAPDPDYNMVQWVKWDQAGMAYADAQADPRNGETLHAQIFLTSVFAVNSYRRLYEVIRALDSEPKKKKSSFALKHFPAQGLCNLDAKETFRELALTLVKANATDQAILKASQDYIRELVAHEIGHTLGFRHNFAGNLAAKYDVSKRRQYLRDYLRTGVLSEDVKSVSSSVMEYLDFTDSVFNGAIIKRDKQALSYDVEAAGMLYQGKKLSEKPPHFCTDTQTGASGAIDCHRWDYGQNVPTFVYDWTKNALSDAPRKLIERFLEARFPLPGVESKEIHQVDLNAHQVADEILFYREGGRDLLLKALTTEGSVLAIREVKSPSGDAFQKSRRKKELDVLHAQVKELGSLQKVLMPIPKDYGEKAYQEFVRLLDTQQYRSGAVLQDKNFEFTAQEIELMKERGRIYFESLEEALIKKDLESLAGTINRFVDPKMARYSDVKPAKTLSKFEEHSLVDEFAALLGERIREYVFAPAAQKTQKIEIEVKPKDATTKPTDENAATKPSTKPVTLPVTLPATVASTQPATTQSATSQPATTQLTKEVVELDGYAYPYEIRWMASKLIKEERAKGALWATYGGWVYQKEAKALAEKVKKLKESLEKAMKEGRRDEFERQIVGHQWLKENDWILKDLYVLAK